VARAGHLLLMDLAEDCATKIADFLNERTATRTSSS